MNPLLEQFLQEARENLAFIDQNIEDIGNGDSELLNSVFRAAHTLKGGSGIVGFESVKVITHHAEDVLDMLRAGKLECSKEIIEALFNAFDEVVNLVEAAEESEDIVDADEETVANIVKELNDSAGKSDAVEEWELPFQLLPDSMTVVDDELEFLTTFQGTIPFSKVELTKDNFAETRLYALFFDVDENCMVFGNDPIYALSLLEDKVEHVSMCLSLENCRTILDCDNEDDLLTYRSYMTAYVYASHEEIEEALFNFMDDLLFAPLDIVSLLNIQRGEVANLDVIKDFAKHGADKFLSGDISGIKESISETLTLIGKDTLQFRRLRRLLRVVDKIDAANYDSMVGFFEVLNSTNVFEVTAESASVPIAEVKVEPTPEPTGDFTAEDKETLFDMLHQQLVQLRTYGDEATKKRVESLIIRPVTAMGYSIQSEFSSVESLIEGIEAVVGINQPKVTTADSVAVEAPKVEIAPTPVVEAPKVEVKETTSTPAATPVENRPEPMVEAVVVEERKVEQKKSVIGKTVKIEQESIDHLMNIIGELLVAKNSLPYLAENVDTMDHETIKRSILEKYSSINRLSMQLQDLIMGMRMLPISYVFDRYPKLVRDISKTLKKKVKLTMEGGDTKLDKNIIEMMADPMIHIMRNSLDHGIELPEDRVAAGKSPEGNVTLKAYAQSDKIVIEITDDGAGINVERVVQKVLEKELMTLEQVEKLSDNEKAELILLAGLSTADSITEFSGRGVGMDVVKKSIEGFGGTINITTASGKGSTMRLAIPVSLAVTSLLHVSMGGVHYGFSMESVSETVKIDKSEVSILHNEPFVYLRGEVIPLLYIKQMLDFDSIDDTLSLVVLNIKGNLIAVVVNELLGQLDVVQKPLEGIIDKHPLFSGTALLGNGQIIMVIDHDGLLGMSHTLKEDQVAVANA